MLCLKALLRLVAHYILHFLHANLNPPSPLFTPPTNSRSVFLFSDSQVSCRQGVLLLFPPACLEQDSGQKPGLPPPIVGSTLLLCPVLCAHRAFNPCLSNTFQACVPTHICPLQIKNMSFVEDGGCVEGRGGWLASLATFLAAGRSEG